MCDARLFAPQTAVLDYPSVHANTSTADNFESMAQQVLAQAPPSFALVGLSMGGILAFEIWRQAPERVTHLALMDTNPHPDAPERRSLRLEQIALVLEGGLRELAIEGLKPMYLAEVNRDDDELLGIILDMAMELGPEVFRNQSMALKDRIDSVPTLATIDCPTLILCGAEDRLCPVDYHTLMAERIPGSTLRVVDRCGHIATLEQPGIVAGALESLLSQ